MKTDRPIWSTQTKVIVIVVLLVIGALVVYRIRPILAPLVLAVILAYILSPFVAIIQNGLHVRRGFAILLAYLLLILILTALLMLVIPVLVRQSSDVLLDLRLLFGQLGQQLAREWVIAGVTVDGNQLINNLSGSFQRLAQPLLDSTLGILVEVFSSLAYVVFMIVISIYLIKDGAQIGAWFEHLVPPVYRSDFVRLRNEVNHIWASFFRGQLILAAVVAVIISSAGFAVGLPFALAMGVLAGILEFIPSLGHGIWIVLATLISLIFGSTWLPLPNLVFALIVILLFAVYTQFDLNFLIPRIIGQSVRLPPMVVILGIVCGAVLAGVLGLMLAAPTIASLRVVGRYVYARLLDEEPMEEKVTAPLPRLNPYRMRRTFRKLGKINE
jgi:predicted PurR-regulated permease PerM